MVNLKPESGASSCSPMWKWKSKSLSCSLLFSQAVLSKLDWKWKNTDLIWMQPGGYWVSTVVLVRPGQHVEPKVNSPLAFCIAVCCFFCFRNLASVHKMGVDVPLVGIWAMKSTLFPHPVSWGLSFCFCQWWAQTNHRNLKFYGWTHLWHSWWTPFPTWLSVVFFLLVPAGTCWQLGLGATWTYFGWTPWDAQSALLSW